MTPILQVENLEVSYGNVGVIDSLSLAIQERSACVILGPNGSGKTTLLNAITGAKEIRAGTVRFNGEDITGASATQIVRKGLVQIPQGRELFPQMTVLDNLRVGAYYHLSSGEIDERLEWVFQRFPRLHERQQQKAITLSGGEQQMVAIARGLMLKPKMLLLDEPSAGLAPAFVREIAQIIQDIVADDVTVVIVEQNIGYALRIARQVCVLRGGRLVFDGTPEEIPTDYEAFFRRFYVGDDKSA